MNVYCINDSTSEVGGSTQPVKKGCIYTVLLKLHSSELSFKFNGNCYLYVLEEMPQDTAYRTSLFIPIDDISIEQLTEILENVEV